LSIEPNIVADPADLHIFTNIYVELAELCVILVSLAKSVTLANSYVGCERWGKCESFGDIVRSEPE
jgi:hypothetical protein